MEPELQVNIRVKVHQGQSAPSVAAADRHTGAFGEPHQLRVVAQKEEYAPEGMS